MVITLKLVNPNPCTFILGLLEFFIILKHLVKNFILSATGVPTVPPNAIYCKGFPSSSK